jgi:hypothetical protein
VTRSTHYIGLRARDYESSILECHSSGIAGRLRTSEVETQALPAAAAAPFMAQRCEDGRSAGVPRCDDTLGMAAARILAFRGRSGPLVVPVHISICRCFNALRMHHVNVQFGDVSVHFAVHFPDLVSRGRRLHYPGPTPHPTRPGRERGMSGQDTCRSRISSLLGVERACTAPEPSACSRPSGPSARLRLPPPSDGREARSCCRSLMGARSTPSSRTSSHVPTRPSGTP